MGGSASCVSCEAGDREPSSMECARCDSNFICEDSPVSIPQLYSPSAAMDEGVDFAVPMHGSAPHMQVGDVQVRVEICSSRPGCEVINHSRDGDDFEERVFSAEVPKAVHLPRGPVRDTVPIYTTTDRCDHSEELLAGEVTYLKVGLATISAHLSAHVNGFTVTPVDKPSKGNPCVVESYGWSPFSVIEVGHIQLESPKAYRWEIFKITLLKKSKLGAEKYKLFCFGCTGDSAVAERDKWVETISAATSNVILAAIPAHTIAVRPVPGNSNTFSRLMAGYLLRLVGVHDFALYYCELQAHSDGAAKLAFYLDEWCEHELATEHILSTSVVRTQSGSFCNVFGIDTVMLCARTANDREVWFRAICNVTVKLKFDAPEPTPDDLRVYRKSVLGRVIALDLPVGDEPGGTPRRGSKGGSSAHELPHLARVWGKPTNSLPDGDLEPLDSPKTTSFKGSDVEVTASAASSSGARYISGGNSKDCADI